MPKLLSISDIVELLFRHKFKVFLLPAIILTMTVAIILFFPRTYRSEARLFLQIGRESVGVDPSAKTGGPTVSLMQSDRDEEIKSAIQVLGSRSIIGRVVDQLTPQYVLAGGQIKEGKNLYINKVKEVVGTFVSVLKSIDPVGDREQAIIEIEKNLRVSAERSSTVLALSVDADSPEAAQKIVEAMIDIYRAEHLRIHRNPGSNNFLSEQTNNVFQQWVIAKNRLSDAKTSLGLVSTAGKKQALETQLQSVDLSILENTRSLSDIEARISELNTQLSRIPQRETTAKKSVPNDGADLMRDALYANQLRLSEIKSRLNADHPSVVSAEQQVNIGKQILESESERRDETTDDINPVYQNLDLELKRQRVNFAGLVAVKKKLDLQLKEILKSITQFNTSEIEIDKLEQQEQIEKLKYAQYNSNLEEARMNKAMEESSISSVSVQQAPTLAEKPVSPSKPIVALGGLLIAIAMTIGAVFASEKFSDLVIDPRVLANRTGLPVLATIEEMARNKKILLNRT